MAKSYKWPSDWSSLKIDFSQQFGIPVGDLYDPLMSWLQGRFVIDVFKLDEMLHSKYGSYEERGLSMRDLIASEYGSDACELIESLI